MGNKFLIIDDSALMRRVISDIIKQNCEYEVLDLATNGLEGLDRLVARPGYYDLIILDINMPKMNGLEMLAMLQKNKMNETVVVVSTVAKEGAVETMKALEMGAVDFLTKPENFYEVKSDSFKEALVRLISTVTGKDFNKKNLVSTPDKAHAAGKPVVNSVRKVAAAGDFRKVNAPLASGNKIIALACSTGGPKSLQSVIPLIPANIDAPIVMVQHMPKGFTLSLANRLDGLSNVKVKEAEDGDVLEKGHVYIAPGGKHIKVQYINNRHVIKFHDAPAVEGLRPCANIMYESLCESMYDYVTCVVLTGMGADGTKGITAIKKSNKKMYVIGQDEESSVVYGMPRALYEAGLTDEVVPLDKIAERIIKNVGVH